MAIVNSNLDEFFMTRVGGLRIQRDAGLLALSDDGMTPAKQLVAIRKNLETHGRMPPLFTRRADPRVVPGRDPHHEL